ncbi:MAG: sugar-binding domain-containing protein [Prevotella sp.]|jgi:hypothetical protein
MKSDMNRQILFTLLCLLLMTSADAAKKIMPYRQQLSLAGTWQICLNGNDEEQATLPGTTDTNQKGNQPENLEETKHLTRLHSYKGVAKYSRTVDIPKDWKGKKVMLTLERTKTTRIYVDGKYCGGSSVIVAPQQFDLSRQLTPGRHQLTICVDNGSGLPEQLYASSHALCEDTQTNWNGIIGDISLQAMNPCHFTRMDIRPDVQHHSAIVLLHFQGKPGKKAKLKIKVCEEQGGKTILVQESPVSVSDTLRRGGTLAFQIDFGNKVSTWDEFQPNLYRLHAELTGEDEMEQTFGLVDFRAQDHHFTVNGHPTFLRGKHDACVFPLTAHVPMDRASWQRYFAICKSYGINHVRFHSWCPPEAAFAEADVQGIYLQPELPFWGSFDKKDSTLMNYLLQAGKDILRTYGHHPSFRMMALGNELWGDIDAMQQFVRVFRAMSPDKLYTFGSNYYLGYQGIQPGMDYITTARLGGGDWHDLTHHTRGSFSYADAYRGGLLNVKHPSADYDFHLACDTASVPVISHETGQFQTYPSYSEIKKYTGVLRPYNLMEFQRRLQQAGLGNEAESFHLASGLWSKELYKAEIESDLRTKNMAGFHLLDLQDYPGQGSAYVGMLDAFMDSKGLTTPEEWRQWCSPVVPLVLLPHFCYAASDTLTAEVKVANYCGSNFQNISLACRLTDGDKTIDEAFTGTCIIREGLTSQGIIRLPLNKVHEARQLTLHVDFIDDTGYPQPGIGHNTYKVWVYPDTASNQRLRKQVLVAHEWNEDVRQALRQGRKVLLIPQDTTNSVGPLFTTDYWNYGMFKTICENNKKAVSPGTLGLYIPQPKSALFRSFPTDNHTSWQWFPILDIARPFRTDMMDKQVSQWQQEITGNKKENGTQPLQSKIHIQVIDNVERNFPLALLSEYKIGNGSLVVCAADIDQLGATVEGRAFRQSLLEWINEGTSLQK